MTRSKVKQNVFIISQKKPAFMKHKILHIILKLCS